jgi:quercetin 2,3-dioxygenase
VQSGELSWTGAGHGIELQPANASADLPVRFLQAWIQPDRLNARPGHARRVFDPAQARARWATLASPDGEEGSVRIHQQAWLRGAVLQQDESMELVLQPARRYWLHVARGAARLDEREVVDGDALGFAGETGVSRLTGRAGRSEVLLFDLPA